MPFDLKKIMSDLVAAYEEAIKAAGDDEAKQEAARKSFLHDVREHGSDVIDPIHAAAFAAGKGEVDKVKGKGAEALKKEKERADALQTELDEVKSKAPDVKKIEDGYKAKLDAANKKAADLEASFAAKERERVMKDATSSVLGKLIAEGVEPLTARGLVLSMKEDGLIVQGEDGAVSYLQMKDKKTPYPEPKEGANPYDALVADVKKTLKPHHLASPVDRGGGIGRGAPPFAGGAARQPGVGEARTEADLLAERRAQIGGSL